MADSSAVHISAGESSYRLEPRITVSDNSSEIFWGRIPHGELMVWCDYRFPPHGFIVLGHLGSMICGSQGWAGSRPLQLCCNSFNVPRYFHGGLDRPYIAAGITQPQGPPASLEPVQIMS